PTAVDVADARLCRLPGEVHPGTCPRATPCRRQLLRWDPRTTARCPASSHREEPRCRRQLRGLERVLSGGRRRAASEAEPEGPGAAARRGGLYMDSRLCHSVRAKVSQG